MGVAAVARVQQELQALFARVTMAAKEQPMHTVNQPPVEYPQIQTRAPAAQPAAKPMKAPAPGVWLLIPIWMLVLIVPFVAGLVMKVNAQTGSNTYLCNGEYRDGAFASAYYMMCSAFFVGLPFAIMACLATAAVMLNRRAS